MKRIYISVVSTDSCEKDYLCPLMKSYFKEIYEEIVVSFSAEEGCPASE